MIIMTQERKQSKRRHVPVLPGRVYKLIGCEDYFLLTYHINNNGEWNYYLMDMHEGRSYLDSCYDEVSLMNLLIKDFVLLENEDVNLRIYKDPIE